MASTSDYKRFLGEKILAEDQVVTYRYLSRALGIHVNLSKQMLYEFHKSQNDRKAGSVHATYLMYGVKRAVEQPSQADDGDVAMAEEPSEHVPIYTLSIAKEEDLSDCLELYDHVSSIHVYSIGPNPTKDLQLLSEVSRQIADMSVGEDTAESQKYGAISNPHAQRRERKGAPPIPKPAAAGPAGLSQKAVPARPAASATTKEAAKEEAKPKAPPASGPFARAAAKDETKSSQTPSSSAGAGAATPSDKKPTPSLKRGGSGIMQAFAKAGAAKPKAKAAAPVAEPAAMSDDGEDDEDVLPAPKQAPDSSINKRKEREEALKRMMEEEDDADKAVEEEEEEEENEREDTPMEEPEEEVPAAAPKPEEPAEVVSASTGDGRRRGRRRVMKKKQIMDDQGYLVTINEPGWESFSEDEAPPKPTSSAKAPASAPAAKSKKAAPKGQGNIMSFFSKKP
ncbi:hypothetical protein MAPG_00867 [Magnaporthiopsis poae ATCC 64411]|uniref:DNA polymerase delta subunit 3 n=1 Tax=Magnaporthiopsis poae (strain ATCC 64411 / 73-15) TaxID=644358 RepID=A0A0C4DM65_MAGP6|nr:hypothetical protein MAPG_00867 [Magnaporthiopsis poae ATCC 64411]